MRDTVEDIRPLAQLVEQWPFKPAVVGSSPTGSKCRSAVGARYSLNRMFDCLGQECHDRGMLRRLSADISEGILAQERPSCCDVKSNVR